MATLSAVPLLSRYVYIHSFITHHSYISHKCNLFASQNFFLLGIWRYYIIKSNVYAKFGGVWGGGAGGEQTSGIVGDVQIANIDLNHFLNTHLTKWLKRKNFSSFFFCRALLIRIAL